ncbi:MAG: tetratricopeptide repeat protein [Calditrichaeota bacterium]|nr:tetratricopeptide repeat protein [Calditrichota bacterium]
MHRSGTSVLAHMLNVMGLFLGEEDELLPPAKDNPEGFWENINFIAINDAILNLLNGSWDNPPEFAIRPEQDKEQWVLISLQAKEVIAKYQNLFLWGWKDPRNCITFPFWKALIPNLKTIIIFRNPIDVAASLQKRDGFSLEKSLDLWFRYNSALVKNVSNSAIWIPYEALLLRPEVVLERLLGWLNWDVGHKQINDAINLIHKKEIDVQKIFENHELPEYIANLYQKLWEFSIIQKEELIDKKASDQSTIASLNKKLSPKNEATSNEVEQCPACGSLATQRARYTADIVTCVDCGLTYLRRLPEASQLKNLYDLYADEFSHMRLPRNPEEVKRSPLRRETFLEEIEPFVKRKGRILDVGCGWGAFLDAARDKGFEPFGIEITPSAVEYANSQLKIQVDSRPLEEQSFPRNSFSLVTMNHVLEHLPRTRQVLNKVFDILEPDGVFAGMVPNFASFCSEMERERWDWLDPNFHYVHFTPETLRANLEKAGFVIEKLYTTRGDYSLHRLKNCVYQKYGKVTDEEFERIVQELEADGRGEEIRFVARKPARPIQPEERPESRSHRQHRATKSSESEVAVRQPEGIARKQKSHEKIPIQVSIIIPVYNQVEYTRVCLEKIYQHADPDVTFEVIVVDNASTDETPAFMKQAQNMYPNLTYIRSEENLKYAGGCNLGAHRAKGKYLVFLNNDTEPEPGWLKQAIRVFQEEPNVGVLGAKLLYPDRTIQHCGIEFQNSKIEHNFIWPFHRYRHAKEDNPLVNRREDVHAVTGACLFIPRKLFQQVGGFDESYGMYFEDTDLCFKVRRKGKRVVYDPDIVVIHHEGKSTENLDKIHELNHKAATIFYQKWEDELVDIALDVLLERVDGKYHYFSDFFYPREYKEGTIVFLYKLFKRLGNFYAFTGGIGDALLFLSTFYDSVDEATVVCAPNNVATARILFNQFPKIKKVYFLPFPNANVWHYTLRNLWYKLPNCKGVGVTPAESYESDWNARLNIFQKYGVKAQPDWIQMFRGKKITDFQVTLQPKGSVRGMVGTKRNIIRPRDWLKLQKYLIDNGITPVILGAPDERAVYPALEGAIDRRSYNLIEQMELIASSDVFIGADSWGKTMAGLAGIPTFVFRSCRGKDLQGWTDPSEFVFMRPWKNMVIVDTFEELIQQFPRRVARPMKALVDYSNYRLQKTENLSPYFEALVKNDQIFLCRLAGLGDVLMAFPLARALKKQYPHLEVNFVTAYAYKHLVDANPDIDRFIPPEVYGEYLVFEPFSVDLNQGRYGYATKHQVDAFLEGLNLQLSNEEKHIELKVSAAAERTVEQKFQDIMSAYRRNGARSWNRVILLHPARGDVNRTWPKERWEELARLLVGSGNLVIIVGNSSASPDRGIHQLDVDGVFHLEDQLSPLEFVALCRRADVLISTDSGPIQLAGATDIAIVGIYSVVRGRNRLPYRHGEPGWKAVAVEPSCPFKGCYEKMNDAAFMEPYLKMIENGQIAPATLFSRWCVHQDKYACMRYQITVEQVWEALQPFLFSETDSARLLEEVDRYLKIRRPDEALKLLEKTVSRGNADARVLRKYIELLKQKGDLVNYIHYLERYVEMNPEDATALNELGVVRWQQERFDEAIALFEKAVSYNGNHPDHIKNLADAYLSQEEFEKAIQLYVYLIQKYPEDTEAYQRLAMLYIENGDYDSARLLLDKALEYHPEDRYLQDWRRLLDTPRVYLAYQFINAGELDTARALLEEELTENPDQLAARLGLGSVLFHQEDYAAAKNVYQQTLTKYPDNAEALFYLAKIHLMQEDWQGFETLRQAHTEAFQAVPELRKLYIQALIEKGDFEQALRELDQYLEVFPEDADGYIILGNLFYEGGKSREALNFYHRALQLEPENEDVKRMVESLSGDDSPLT